MSAEKSLKVIAERLENIETLMLATDERSAQIEKHLQTIVQVLTFMAKEQGLGPSHSVSIIA